MWHWDVGALACFLSCVLLGPSAGNLDEPRDSKLLGIFFAGTKVPNVDAYVILTNQRKYSLLNLTLSQ